MTAAGPRRNIDIEQDTGQQVTGTYSRLTGLLMRTYGITLGMPTMKAFEASGQAAQSVRQAFSLESKEGSADVVMGVGPKLS